MWWAIEMDELKPCPFCGSDPSMRITGYGAVYVRCPNCGVETPYYQNVELATLKWNMRIEC